MALVEQGRGTDTTHVLLALNYVCLCVSFGLIVSDLCGLPYWYGRRVHPPITPDGHLQFLSEHIMRCKYSSDSRWLDLPWVVVYLFNVLLVQALYTWVRLNMVMQMQNAHFTGSRGVRLHPLLHVGFAVFLGISLLGLLIVVEFDHDYIPADMTDKASAIAWVDRSRTHFFGVVMLIGGYFVLHLPVIYVYTLRVFSAHDYTCMCNGPVVDSARRASRPAMIRRGLYIGSESVYLLLMCLFAILVMIGFNAGAVTTEYVLLLAFLCVAFMDLLVSYRLLQWYRM